MRGILETVLNIIFILLLSAIGFVKIAGLVGQISKAKERVKLMSVTLALDRGDELIEIPKNTIILFINITEKNSTEIIKSINRACGVNNYCICSLRFEDISIDPTKGSSTLMFRTKYSLDGQPFYIEYPMDNDPFFSWETFPFILTKEDELVIANPLTFDLLNLNSMFYCKRTEKKFKLFGGDYIRGIANLKENNVLLVLNKTESGNLVQLFVIERRGVPGEA